MNKQLLIAANSFCTFLLLLVISNKSFACTGRDIVFTNITFTSITSDTYYYSYEIKNIGTTDIAMSQVVIQNYVSSDNQVGNDAAAGGSFINNQSAEILSPGETFSGTIGAYPFPANPISTYPYLVANVYLDTDAECDVTNNYLVKLVQISTAIFQPSSLANATVNWSFDSKSFTVKDWSGSKLDLQYGLYTPAGQLILSGNTRENEPTPLKSLTNGIYILYLSDGQKVYSSKIMY